MLFKGRNGELSLKGLEEIRIFQTVVRTRSLERLCLISIVP